MKSLKEKVFGRICKETEIRVREIVSVYDIGCHTQIHLGFSWNLFSIIQRVKMAIHEEAGTLLQ